MTYFEDATFSFVHPSVDLQVEAAISHTHTHIHARTQPPTIINYYFLKIQIKGYFSNKCIRDQAKSYWFIHSLPVPLSPPSQQDHFSVLVSTHEYWHCLSVCPSGLPSVGCAWVSLRWRWMREGREWFLAWCALKGCWTLQVMGRWGWHPWLTLTCHSSFMPDSVTWLFFF